jgi:hypothetical protein
MFVLRAEIITIFGSKMVTISARSRIVIKTQRFDTPVSLSSAEAFKEYEIRRN